MSNDKLDEFYKNYTHFSYSSINKLLFSPKLFYKDYIEGDREISTEKHLIEGKLIHCLLFEPENLKDKFNIVPGKTPSDNVRRVLKDMAQHTDEKNLDKVKDFVVLDSLKRMNLYQSLKANDARIAKIKKKDHKSYWDFLCNPVVDVIDNDTFERCTSRVDVIKPNPNVMELLNKNETDFELDPVKTFSEEYIECSLNKYKFGLKGFVDHYIINDDDKTITIIDLKTTNKTLSDFAETVDYYRYWLQAIIYCKLVYEKHKDDCDGYEILFKFIVIDKYDQVYAFPVTEPTMSKWGDALAEILETVDYHYTNKNYTLPYDFLVNDVSI